jgi:hypothetical protein
MAIRDEANEDTRGGARPLMVDVGEDDGYDAADEEEEEDENDVESDNAPAVDESESDKNNPDAAVAWSEARADERGVWQRSNKSRSDASCHPIGDSLSAWLPSPASEESMVLAQTQAALSLLALARSQQ